MCHIWHSNREEVIKHMIKRTISGMIGAGSLAHNRRDFVAENVDWDRVQLNICYKNENLKEVYKELFDDAVERYNVGKRKDRQIANYYEKIRQGKQEKLFHEVIFQISAVRCPHQIPFSCQIHLHSGLYPFIIYHHFHSFSTMKSCINP